MARHSSRPLKRSPVDKRATTIRGVELSRNHRNPGRSANIRKKNFPLATKDDLGDIIFVHQNMFGILYPSLWVTFFFFRRKVNKGTRINHYCCAFLSSIILQVPAGLALVAT